MKLITRFLYLPAACIALLSSCAEDQTESYDKFEDQALEAYMTQKHPELLENYQTEGGYYVDVLEAGDPDAKPVNDTICWVKFDFSGRDLSGNIAALRKPISSGPSPNTPITCLITAIAAPRTPD